MINKWKAKIVQRGLYNRRNPQWREDPGINREGTVAISRTPVTILIQYLLEQSSSDCAENKLSLINSIHFCLIVVNTILTIIHALKSSSLTYSLQIYCTRLTGPRTLGLGCKTSPYRCKCTFNLYILTFFHFSSYILFLPLFFPKPINMGHLSP